MLGRAGLKTHFDLTAATKENMDKNGWNESTKSLRQLGRTSSLPWRAARIQLAGRPRPALNVKDDAPTGPSRPFAAWWGVIFSFLLAVSQKNCPFRRNLQVVCGSCQGLARSVCGVPCVKTHFSSYCGRSCGGCSGQNTSLLSSSRMVPVFHMNSMTWVPLTS